MVQHSFNEPFNAEGNWYKGNLHLHTTNSDGTLRPLEMIRQYEKNGFHFLSITDHYKLTEVKERTDLLLIKGEELDFGYTHFHFVALDIKAEIQPPPKGNPKVSPQNLIDKVKSQGGEVILAHPYWSGLCITDMLSIKDYIGIEVYNAYALVSVNKGYSMAHWDDLLIRGKNILGFAGDDSHWRFDSYRPNVTASAWIMVKAKMLTTEEIMRSIRKGLFYASCGPVIKSLSIGKDTIRISTSPVKSISFVAPNGYGQMFSAVRKDFIDSAEYEFHNDSAEYELHNDEYYNVEYYVRIQCMDEDGRMAWTNPIFFRDR